MKPLLLTLGLFFFAQAVCAAPSFEFAGYYSSDSFKMEEATTHGQTYFGLDILTNLDTKKIFYAGFHVGQMSVSDGGTATTSFSSLDMGPFVAYMIDRKGVYSLNLGYNVKATGSYNDGTNTTIWNGTSLQASLGCMPEVDDDFFVGFKLNYYSASYSKSILESVATDVSYTRAFVFPTFNIVWRH